MIAYRSTTGAGLPPDLDGLEHTELRQVRREDGHLAAVCPGWQALPPAEGSWIDCAPGWACAEGAPWIMPPQRQQARLRTIPVADAQGRGWQAPCVLLAYPLDGLAFDVPLGAHWKPEPDAAQRTLIGAARWARAELLRGIECRLDEGRELFEDIPITLDLAMAARATADLLASVHHVAPATLQALRLIDRALIQAVLLAAAGLHLPVLRRLSREVEHG